MLVSYAVLTAILILLFGALSNLLGWFWGIETGIDSRIVRTAFDCLRNRAPLLWNNQRKDRLSENLATKTYMPDRLIEDQ